MGAQELLMSLGPQHVEVVVASMRSAMRDFLLLFGMLPALMLSSCRLIYQKSFDVRHTLVAEGELLRVRQVDSAEQSEFEKAGCVILRDVVPPALCASLKVEAHRIFKQ